MPENQLSIDKDFVVAESVVLDLCVGLFFFILFFLAVKVSPHDDPDQQKPFVKSLYITLIPALFFTFKGLINKKTITINKTGIYNYNTLITDWKNFIRAYIDQQTITGSISDNFVLFIEHYKDNQAGYFECKIPLTNTQNKSEEDVIAAINFFLEQSRKAIAN